MEEVADIQKERSDYEENFTKKYKNFIIKWSELNDEFTKVFALYDEAISVSNSIPIKTDTYESNKHALERTLSFIKKLIDIFKVKNDVYRQKKNLFCSFAELYAERKEKLCDPQNEDTVEMLDNTKRIHDLRGLSSKTNREIQLFKTQIEITIKKIKNDFDILELILAKTNDDINNSMRVSQGAGVIQNTLPGIQTTLWSALNTKATEGRLQKLENDKESALQNKELFETIQLAMQQFEEQVALAEKNDPNAKNNALLQKGEKKGEEKEEEKGQYKIQPNLKRQDQEEEKRF